MGYKLDNNMNTSLYSEALAMAIKNRKQPTKKSIHHSDRGFNIVILNRLNLLKNELKMSMTAQYNPYENAITERINRTLKYEYGLRNCIKKKAIAQ